MMLAPENQSPPASRRVALAVAALVLGTLALYWPVHSHGFVDFDDATYITANEHVTTGLTWSNFIWAFTQSHAANWHPLTWISHMLDVQWFGLDAGKHHLVSALIHAVNAALLFGLLHRWTGAFWRAAFVAAFFAWHPLRVESVAWAAERKDVLSLFFFLLTLLAYGEYVRRHRRSFYFAALGLFLLGLMSKSMLVTTPCVLLLLDFWPLARRRTQDDGRTNWRELVREKLPFFGLSIACSVVALVTQSHEGAVVSAESLPLEMRLLNAFLSVVRYLGKLVWPEGLNIFYPYQHWAEWKPALAALFIAAVCAIAWRWRRTRPWLFTGWFWFLGTLVPVIGLVQVGQQAMADRYTYLPSIGIVIAVAWLAGECARRWPRVRLGLATTGALALAGCLVGTRWLLPTWQNSETLFTRALEMNPKNPVALINLGYLMKNRGDRERAREYLTRALQLTPGQEQVHFQLGNLYLDEGNLPKAGLYFTEAMRLNPSRAETHWHLGEVRMREGSFTEAAAQLQEAVRLNPGEGRIHHNLAVVLARLGRVSEAVPQYEEALKLLPDSAETHTGLGMALAAMGRLPEAEAHLRAALNLPKVSLEAVRGLGMVLAQESRFAEAEPLARRCVEAQPENPAFQLDYGWVLVGLQRRADALPYLRKAVRLKPDWVPAMERLAWVLATAPEAQLRDGNEAARIAERAVELTQRKFIEALDSLGAAQAEQGRFELATRTVGEALELARKQNSRAVSNLTAHAEAFRQNRPWRDGQ